MVISSVTETHTRFIGRDTETKDMVKLMHDALTGRGQFVILEGEAGIGKTRLVGEVGAMAREEGFEFLTGRCLSLEQAEPYQPFMEALGDKMGDAIIEDDRDIPLGLMGMSDSNGSSRHGGMPLGLLPIAGGAQTDISRIDIQTEKDKLFDKMLDTIIRSSQRKPLMLFIDDLQWADSGTLQMLVFIARNIGNARVLLCTAYRTEEVTEDGKPLAFYDMFRQAARNIAHHQITLERMSQPEIAEMINSILSVHDVPQKFSSKLYSESEGNPFFVEEVLRSLMDEGIILRHGHIWDAGVDLSSIRIPNTIKDVISHRIARLNEDEKKILRYASVAGDLFTFDILKDVTEIDEEKLLDALDRLMEGDIIQEVPNTEDEEFRFDHKLIRSVIYESMSKSRVRMMHKTVGEIIEKLYPDNIDAWAYDLSRHFTLGKHTQKSYTYSMMAGDKAFNALAFDRAVDYYVSALRIMDLLSPAEGFDRDAEKVRVSMHVGDIYFALGLWNNSTKFYEDALKANQKVGNQGAEVKALISLGHSKRSLGNYRDAETHFEKASEIAKKLADVLSQGEIQRGLGYVHWRRGENNDAIEHYNQSISFSMKAGDLSSMAKTFIELGNVYNNWGQYEKAIEYYEKAITELQKLNDYSEMARAYNNIGDTFLHMKEWDRAIDNFEKCRAASEKIGNRNMVAWALFNSAEALAYIGQLDKAESQCMTALNICETQDDKIGMNGIFRCLGIVYRLKKHWEKAIENINKSIVILEMLDIPYDLANTYWELALTYEEMGEKMAALDNFRVAQNYYESVGAKNQAAEAEERVKALDGQ